MMLLGMPIMLILVSKCLPPSFTYQQKKKFFYDLRHYFWDDPHLYKEGADGILRRCIPEHEQEEVLRKCHNSDYGGHHAGERKHIRFFNQVFIGLLYLKMLKSLLHLVMSVKGLVTVVDVMKCL